MRVVAHNAVVDVLIGSQSLTAVPNLLNSVYILEGVPALCPSVMLILNDKADALKGMFALSDGNLIQVILGKTVDDTETKKRDFFLFSIKETLNAPMPTSVILGYLAVPKYMSEAGTEYYNGTSEQVLERLAEKCGLTFSGPTAAGQKKMTDNQIWINMCQSRSKFATEQITKHAYADSLSGMAIALTSTKELRFRNLIETVKTPADRIKTVFLIDTPNSSMEAGKDVYTVWEAQYRSDAGLVNNMINYGAVQSSHSLTGEQKDLVSLAVDTSKGFLAVNQAIKDEVGSRTRIDYTNLDSGNVHPNYYCALYQNQRIQGLFTERVSLLVNVQTCVELLEPVVVKRTNLDTLEPQSQTDVYIVVGKTLAVRGAAIYVERIELVRMTVRDPGVALLAAPDSGSPKSQVGASNMCEIAVPESKYSPTSPMYKNALPSASAAYEQTQGMAHAAQQIPRAIAPLNNQVYNATPMVRNIQTALTSQGDPVTKVNAAVASIPQLYELNRMMTPAVNSVQGLNSATSQMYGTCKTFDPQMPRSIMAQPGGPATSIGAALPTLSVLTDMQKVFNSLRYQLPPELQNLRLDPNVQGGYSVGNWPNASVNLPGVNVSVPFGSLPPANINGYGTPQQLQNIALFNQQVELFNQNVNQMRDSAAGVWNTGVQSAYPGQVMVPQQSNWMYPNAILDNSIFIPGTTIPQNPQQVGTQFINGAMLPNVQGQPRWLPPDSSYGTWPNNGGYPYPPAQYPQVQYPYNQYGAMPYPPNQYPPGQVVTGQNTMVVPVTGQGSGWATVTSTQTQFPPQYQYMMPPMNQQQIDEYLRVLRARMEALNNQASNPGAYQHYPMVSQLPPGSYNSSLPAWRAMLPNRSIVTSSGS